MNKNIDLTQILKDCTEGFELYSNVYGKVMFEKIKGDSLYPIVVSNKEGGLESFTADGKMLIDYDGECTLFPSKDQRDWSKFTAPWYKKEKFDPKTFKPFDKVLVRDDESCKWRVNFYSHEGESMAYPFRCIGKTYTYCIPYNDDTKHLVGTTDEAPEYYRYWEN